MKNNLYILIINIIINKFKLKNITIMNILIIHYNTPELTNALVQSINKYV